MGYHISISIPRPWCRCQHWVLKKVHLAMCLQLSYKTNLFPLYQWWKPKLTLRFYASHYSPHSWWPCGGWPTPTSLPPPTHPPTCPPTVLLNPSTNLLKWMASTRLNKCLHLDSILVLNSGDFMTALCMHRTYGLMGRGRATLDLEHLMSTCSNSSWHVS